MFLIIHWTESCMGIQNPITAPSLSPPLPPLSLTRDVYVRENGMLLVGNLAFNDTPPKRCGSGNNSNKNAADFLLLLCKLLSTVLCLSRRETVSLQDSAEGLPEGVNND